MSYIDFAGLKARFNIEEAIPLLGLELKQNGDQYRGLCPVCESDDKRALVITESKQAFYCFGCKKGGDVITLVSRVKNISLKEAASFITDGTVPVRNSTSTERKGTVPEEYDGLQPLTYLDGSHETVEALGLSSATRLRALFSFTKK